jgi:hypothetical protein
MIPACPDPRACGGQFNAWVAAGATRDERRSRLAQCPEHLRVGVESHVQTVFALRSLVPSRPGRASG